MKVNGEVRQPIMGNDPRESSMLHTRGKGDGGVLKDTARL